MRKPAFCTCENKGADQLCGNPNFKPLAIFCGCSVWFVSNLVGNPEDRFSRHLAQCICRREEAVFFIYDHNLLKKEEDDLIDAILYFSPEHVSTSSYYNDIL